MSSDHFIDYISCLRERWLKEDDDGHGLMILIASWVCFMYGLRGLPLVASVDADFM